MGWLRYHRRQQGSVLAVAAAAMLVIVLLGSLLWGMAYRISQIQRAEAALRESTRTAAQTWSYADFAQGHFDWQPQPAVVQRATELLSSNLANVPGLVGDPRKVAKRATWSIVAASEQCHDQVVAELTLCGQLDITVRSLPLGFGGTSVLHIVSASSVDVTP